MAEEQTVNLAEAAEPAQQRQRSTVSFPYVDLEAAESIAGAIHANVGAGSCEDSQLAPWAGFSPKSSGYRTQVYAARIFGLIESDSGKHKLTELGREIVDPNKADKARASAFLKVELFGKVYEHYNGHVLPPTAALEKELVELGVAPKQKSRARIMLEKSADRAGYFKHGRDRLVTPGFAPPDPNKQKETKIQRGGGGDGGSGDGGDGSGEHSKVDPVIAALFRKLPPASSKVDWPVKARLRWLRMVEMAFQEVYGELDPAIEITLAQQTKSKHEQFFADDDEVPF